MKEYVQYHNVKTQGPWKKNEAIAYSTKKIDDCIGNRIWIISRDDARDFIVASCFVVERIEKRGKWFYYEGRSEGISSECNLKQTNWFSQFFLSVGNGAFGLTRIREEYSARLRELIM